MNTLNQFTLCKDPYQPRLFCNRIEMMEDHPDHIDIENLEDFILGDGGGECLSQCYSESARNNYYKVAIDAEAEEQKWEEEKERQKRFDATFQEIIERRRKEDQERQDENAATVRRMALESFARAMGWDKL